MTDEAIQKDVSQEEPVMERPFVHPMSAYEQDDSKPDPRQELIERMADMNNDDRATPDGAVIDGVVPAVDGVPVADLEPTDDLDQYADEGGSVEPMHEPVQEEVDPLQEYIILDGETPMFKTVVDGQERLIPLDAARRELQKREAGDIRLQQNAEWQKQLEQREAALLVNEQAYRQSTQAISTQQSPPSEQDVGDVDLDAKAREVVSGLFTGSEEEAAAKLATLLRDTRTAQPTQSVDANAIAEQAAAAAEERIVSRERQEDVKIGYQKFADDYPEIANDENLFRYADSLTDAIVTENPNWKPSQVMLEAGKRTREWVQSFKTDTPEPSEAQDNDRQERKRNLRPMPRARQGTPEAEPIAQDQTPSDYLAELRQQRGQP